MGSFSGRGGAYYWNFTEFHYSKNLHIKRTGVWGVQADLYIGCFLQNQPENVLENTVLYTLSTGEINM